MTVNATTAQSLINAYWNNQTSSTSNAWWSKIGNDGTDNLWQYMSNQVDVQVSMCMENVGERLVYDLAENTADYLKDYEDLAEDYVLVIVDEDGQRTARAYRREELVSQYPEEEQEDLLQALKKNPLLYHDDASDLPAMSGDEDIQGLAAVAQDFLDKFSDVLDILERDGYLPWGE